MITIAITYAEVQRKNGKERKTRKRDIVRMINEMSVEGRNVQTADAFSVLLLSYVFFSNCALITVSFSFRIRWIVKESAPSDRNCLTIHLVPDCNYRINIQLISNSLVNF